jgi:hypothetical protein
MADPPKYSWEMGPLYAPDAKEFAERTEAQALGMDFEIYRLLSPEERFRRYAEAASPLSPLSEVIRGPKLLSDLLGPELDAGDGRAIPAGPDTAGPRLTPVLASERHRVSQAPAPIKPLRGGRNPALPDDSPSMQDGSGGSRPPEEPNESWPEPEDDPASPRAPLRHGAQHSAFSFGDLVWLVTGALTATPLVEAGWHAVVNEPEHGARGVVAIIIGMTLGLAEATFHWWKGKISDDLRRRVERHALWVLAVAMILFFAWSVGPEVYERAAATHPSSSVSQADYDTLKSKFDQATNDLTAANKKLATANLSPANSALAIANILTESQNTIDEQRQKLAALQRELEDAHRASSSSGPAPASNTAQSPDSVGGPITWDHQMGVSQTGDSNGLILLAILMSGKNTSSSPVQLKGAYLISELTGAKEDLKINIGINNLVPIPDVNEIPPGALIELWAPLRTPLNATDFMAQWGRFQFHADYDNTKFDMVFDESFVANRLAQFPSAHIGPHVTKKVPAQ